jgi:hypothetical protein
MSLRGSVNRVAIVAGAIVACLAIVSSAGAVVPRKAGQTQQEYVSVVTTCQTIHIPLVGSFTICSSK